MPVRPRRSPHASIYVVRPGDSLTAIANRFGLAHRPATENRFDPDHVLLIGARLKIPTPALEATPTDIRDRLDAWSAMPACRSTRAALAWMESGYQPKIVSDAGARGVLQTLPSTRHFVEDVLVGHPLPQTVDADIEVGVLYLRHLLQQFGGDQHLALAAWYQGEAGCPAGRTQRRSKPFVADVLALEERM